MCDNDFDKYIAAEADGSQAYYRRELTKLDAKKKQELKCLVEKMNNAGCPAPFSWAFSEVTEGIPQFARYLILKELHRSITDVEEGLSCAEDFTEDIESLYQTAAEAVGEDHIKRLLTAYAKGIIGILISLIDDGNLDRDRDGVSWSLIRTDAEGTPTGQIIEGLHEDFAEFDKT